MQKVILCDFIELQSIDTISKTIQSPHDCYLQIIAVPIGNPIIGNQNQKLFEQFNIKCLMTVNNTAYIDIERKVANLQNVQIFELDDFNLSYLQLTPQNEEGELL